MCVHEAPHCGASKASLAKVKRYSIACVVRSMFGSSSVASTTAPAALATTSEAEEAEQTITRSGILLDGGRQWRSTQAASDALSIGRLILRRI